jgi:hypothetical protein
METQGDEKRPLGAETDQDALCRLLRRPTIIIIIGYRRRPCIDDCQYSRQAVLPCVGITGSSATPAHLRVRER